MAWAPQVGVGGEGGADEDGDAAGGGARSRVLVVFGQGDGGVARDGESVGGWGQGGGAGVGGEGDGGGGRMGLGDEDDVCTVREGGEEGEFVSG